ncbi:MAG: helix-turn-helix domain-containing protein [bacterium]
MANKSHPDTRLEALRQRGTLNPRPQAVRVSLFEKSEFFDPRDLVQVKYEMVRQASEADCTVTQVAASFGFSRVAFYQIRKRFSESGFAGLLPQPRGPQRSHKLTDKIMDYVEEILGQDTSVRASTLTERIDARFGISIHPRSIERALARRQKKRRR